MAYNIVLALMLCLVCIYAQKASECPEPNVLQSNKNQDKKYLNLEIRDKSTQGISVDKPEDLFATSDGGGQIVTSNDVVLINANFKDNTLLSIEKVSAEFKVATEASLRLLQGSTVLLSDEQEVQQGTQWVKVDFDIKNPVLGVDGIEIGFFSPTGELKIRNIVLIACVETGWCPWKGWGSCSKSCGEGEQSRSRVCECPNPDPDRFICATGKPIDNRVCDEGCCPQPPKWSKWSMWSECTATCGSASRFRTRKCNEDECPDGSQCKGPARQTELCDLPCCEEVIDGTNPVGVTIRHVGPSTDVNPNLVWRGTNRFIFLRENSMGTDALIVTFSSPQIIFEVGIETLLASYVKMNFMDVGETWMSNVPDADIPGFQWDKHRKSFRPDGIQPVSKVRIDFGYPTGEIRVQKLYFVVCPTEEAGCGPGGKGSCVGCGSCNKNAVCNSGAEECSGKDCCCFPKRLSRKEKRQCR